MKTSTLVIVLVVLIPIIALGVYGGYYLIQVDAAARRAAETQKDMQETQKDMRRTLDADKARFKADEDKIRHTR